MFHGKAMATLGAVMDIQNLIDCLRTKEGIASRNDGRESPCTVASKALYTGHRSDEDSAQYQRCLNAQARFNNPRLFSSVRTKRDGNSGKSTDE